MPRLWIVIELDEDVDPTTEDPHTVADSLLDGHMPTFSPGTTFSHYVHATGDTFSGEYVSAEWGD